MKTKLCLLIGFCVFTINAQHSNYDIIHLSNLNLNKVEQPWWNAQKDKSINGVPVQIGKQKFKKAIGTISRSSIYIFLNGKSNTFKSVVGIQNKGANFNKNDIEFNALGDGSKLFYTKTKKGKTFVGIGPNLNSIKKGSVKFLIKGDGKILWKSKTIRGGNKAIPVEVNVKNVQLLELLVLDNEDGVSGDNAVWAQPELHYKNYKPILVDGNFLNRMENADEHFINIIKPKIKHLSKPSEEHKHGIKEDWLIKTPTLTSGIFQSENEKEILLSNGLISRTFRLTPNAATVNFKNLVNGETLIRGVRPEILLTLDGKSYQVGGLDGQIEYGYLKKEWLDNMWSPKESFQLMNFKVEEIQQRINWKNKRWARVNKNKPKGKSLRFIYKHKKIPNILVNVIYDIYDGIPMIGKRFTITNNSDKKIQLNNFTSEVLSFVEAESSVEKQNGWETPNIHIESDYAFHSMSMKNANKVVHWEKDDRYTSQVSYNKVTPCLLECKLPLGPNEIIKSGAVFKSFNIWELPYDSYDKQRKGLYTNKMYETLAPWVTENPLFLHLTSTNEKVVKNAIDQCKETGYEMVILSFGSGLNMEDTSDKNIAKFKNFADYAHSKGIEIGGYSLLSSRWISDEVDVINPKTGKRGGTIHGSSPCLNSQWGIDYFKKLNNFFDKTGFDLLEHDGSYPGQYCASTTHIGHKGLEDSQWKSWKRITDFYKTCNEKGISLNIPDWYYLSGSTKNGIGYREVNWSLPRERQLVLGRQNMFDGTFERLPSMSWTFVPLVQYHGGGSEATIEPLNDHLDAYTAHMMQNYGMGVQACYRGPRLYDTNKTKQTVINVVNWYKQYRKILNAPIIHLKRADGLDLDGFMHVDPKLKEKGFVMLFNPTSKAISKKIKLPLYYTGIETKAFIREKEGIAKPYILKRDYSIEIKVNIPAMGYSWFVIE